jgi:hypothetical protein
MQARNEMRAQMKMVPRRPNQWLRGSVSQQPRIAQHSCKRVSRDTSKAWHKVYIRSCVHKAEKPLIVRRVTRVGVDVKLRSKKQIRAVDDGFVHLICD